MQWNKRNAMICIQLKIKYKIILLKTLENGLNKSYFMTYQPSTQRVGSDGSGIELNKSVTVNDRVFPDLKGKKKKLTQKPNLNSKYNYQIWTNSQIWTNFQNSKKQFQIFTKSKPQIPKSKPIKKEKKKKWTKITTNFQIN